MDPSLRRRPANQKQPLSHHLSRFCRLFVPLSVVPPLLDNGYEELFDSTTREKY